MPAGCDPMPARSWSSSRIRRSPASSSAGSRGRASRTGSARPSTGCATHPGRRRRSSVSSSDRARHPALRADDRRQRRALPRGMPEHQLRVVGRAVRGPVRARVRRRRSAAATRWPARAARRRSTSPCASSASSRATRCSCRRLTFVASANPVRYVGATPILVDSEAETYNLDPALVVAELDRRARARTAPAARRSRSVHLVGHPADIDPIVECGRAARRDRRSRTPRRRSARRYTAGRFAGRHVGTIGRVGCFSFNGNKLITTGGGGMIVTDDEPLARARSPPVDPGETARTRLRPRRGRLQLPADEPRRRARRRPARAAAGAARRRAGESPPATTRPSATCPGSGRRRRATWADPSFWLYTAALDPDRATTDRDAVIDELAEREIEVRPLWTPLHRTRLYADATRLGGAVADRIFGAAFSLPSTSSLGYDDQARVVDALRDAHESRSRAPATRASDG